MGLFGFESRKERRTAHTDIDKLRAELATAEESAKYWRDRCAVGLDLSPADIDALKAQNVHLANSNAELRDQVTTLRKENTAAAKVARCMRTGIKAARDMIDQARRDALDADQRNLVQWLDELASLLHAE